MKTHVGKELRKQLFKLCIFSPIFGIGWIRYKGNLFMLCSIYKDKKILDGKMRVRRMKGGQILMRQGDQVK